MSICPVCQKKRNQQINPGVFKCSSCGTLYLAKIPAERQIQSTLELDAEKIIRTANDKKLLLVQLSRLNYLANFIPPPARILEIGPGNGLFLQKAIKRGYQVTGLDKSEKIRRYLQGQGYKMVKSLAEVKNENFDLVVLFDVIEHIANPAAFILVIKSKLKPKGFLMITTPNSKGFSGKILKNKFWGLKPTGHLLIFSPDTLALFLRQAGFKIIKTQTDSISWWYLGPTTWFNQILNKILYVTLRPFKNYLLRQNLGDNLQVLAQKV